MGDGPGNRYLDKITQYGGDRVQKVWLSASPEEFTAATAGGEDWDVLLVKSETAARYAELIERFLEDRLSAVLGIEYPRREIPLLAPLPRTICFEPATDAEPWLALIHMFLNAVGATTGS